MKNLTFIFLLISSLFFSLKAKGQEITLMNNVASTATGNYSTHLATGRLIGSVQISTNDSFNGSTTTAALQASNDDITWSTVFADDNTTPLSFTLSAGSNSYVWLIKATMFQHYRIVYTKGNATLGTVKAILNAQ